MTSGISSSIARTTWPRQACGESPCMTPTRRQLPSAAGPGSRSTSVTSYPRRASPIVVNVPTGPAPMTSAFTMCLL